MLSLLVTLALALIQAEGCCVPSEDCEISSEIETFWCGAGVPECVLESAAQCGGPHILYKSTDLPHHDQSPQCIQSTITDNGDCTYTETLTGLFEGECSYTEIAYNTYTESEGIIFGDGNDARFIFVGNGVVAWYYYSTEAGVEGCPLGGIYVEASKYNDCCTQTTLQFAEGLMELLGFDLTYSACDTCYETCA